MSKTWNFRTGKMGEDTPKRIRKAPKRVKDFNFLAQIQEAFEDLPTRTDYAKNKASHDY